MMMYCSMVVPAVEAHGARRLLSRTSPEPSGHGRYVDGHAYLRPFGRGSRRVSCAPGRPPPPLTWPRWSAPHPLPGTGGGLARGGRSPWHRRRPRQRRACGAEPTPGGCACASSKPRPRCPPPRLWERNIGGRRECAAEGRGCDGGGGGGGCERGGPAPSARSLSGPPARGRTDATWRRRACCSRPSLGVGQKIGGSGGARQSGVCSRSG